MSTNRLHEIIKQLRRRKELLDDTIRRIEELKED